MDERDNLYEQIVEEYKKTGSVKQVVENLNTNTIKVRRVLITEGLWESESSRSVGELYLQGKSVKEIAEILCMSEKNVQSYMPYTRGAYGGMKSSDAERSGEYRTRKAKAAETQALVTEGGKKEDSDMVPNNDMPESNIIDFTKIRKPLMQAENEDREMAAVMKLRLELIAPFYAEDDDKGLDMKEEEKADFLKKAKAKEGIIREVLVPAEMNLHAMHYMIQKLFGWQNSHLHNYFLSNKDFEMVTDGKKVDEYLSLCGTLFRFPGSEVDDQFWDDDYDEEYSIKSWLKSKYTRGFMDLAAENSYPMNRQHVKELKEKYQKEFKLKKKMTLDELNDIVMFEGGYNVLIESLRLRQLFTKGASYDQKPTPKAWHVAQKTMIERKEDYYRDFEREDPDEYAGMIELFEDLINMRKNANAFERAEHFGQAQEIKKKYKKTPEQIIDEIYEQIRIVEAALIKDMAEGNPTPVPFTESFYYNYDFGDEWTVKITCLEAYTPDQNFDWTNPNSYNLKTGERKLPKKELRYTDSAGNIVSEKEAEKLNEVYLQGKPICVYADGLNVMDDVGGLWGYQDFLETIYGDDPDEASDSKSWAKWMGWTGRKTKAENIL